MLSTLTLLGQKLILSYKCRLQHESHEAVQAAGDCDMARSMVIPVLLYTLLQWLIISPFPFCGRCTRVSMR